MNITKQVGITLASAVVVVLVAFGLYHPSQTVMNQPGVTQVVKGTTPEISSPYLSVNGVIQWYQQESFKSGTSTVCSFASPINTSGLAQSNIASVTPSFISVRTTTSTSTSVELDVGTSTGLSGTSSANFVTNFTIPPNATSTAVYWDNPGGKGNDWHQNNTEYINVVLGTLNTSNNPQNGVCQVTWTQY